MYLELIPLNFTVLLTGDTLVLAAVQVLTVVADCIEKEGYSNVVADDLQGEPAHTSPRQR